MKLNEIPFREWPEKVPKTYDEFLIAGLATEINSVSVRDMTPPELYVTIGFLATMIHESERTASLHMGSN